MRDSLLVRLRELDVQRAGVLQQLEELEVRDEVSETDPKQGTPRRATPSLAGARIRWVGA